MPAVFRCFPVVGLLCASALFAQTYTPQHIRFEGPPASDQPQLLTLTGLHEGAPLTKEQIEAAMGKLAETGSYTDLSYTVDAKALVITLTMAAGNQAQVVRFANLVWWPPEELEKLLEARVPLYHGKLPLTGSLTDQVIAAAEALLREKGIENAKVETLQLNNERGAISLSLSHPAVLLGDISVPNLPKDGSAALTKLHGRFQDEDFDRYTTPRVLASETSAIFADSGFLDAHAGQPTFAAPRKDHDRFLIDATVPVSGLDLYRVSRVTFAAAPPPLSERELRSAAKLNPGDAAGVYELRVAEKTMENLYTRQGYLDADVSADVRKDTAAHTAEYVFTLKPGEVYHVSAVTAEGLPAPLQSAFAKDWRMPKDTAFDTPFLSSLARTLQGIAPPGAISYGMDKDAHTHTVALHLRPRQGAR